MVFGLWLGGSMALAACDDVVECPLHASTGFIVRLECDATVLASQSEEASVWIRSEGDGAWVECPQAVGSEARLCGPVNGASVSFSCVAGRPFVGPLGELFRVEPPARFELKASFIDRDGATWQGTRVATWRRTSQGCMSIPKSTTVAMSRAPSE